MNLRYKTKTVTMIEDENWLADDGRCAIGYNVLEDNKSIQSSSMSTARTNYG